MFINLHMQQQRLFEYIAQMSSKDKRYVFSVIRKLWETDKTYAECVNIFLPRVGITLGEFVVFNVLNSSTCRKQSNNEKTKSKRC